MNLFSQHSINMNVVLDNDNKILTVNQEITYFNQSTDTLNFIIFNDWNNAYSDKNSLLGKRFSDEFIRSFHIASDSERGKTTILSFKNENRSNLVTSRLFNNIDLLQVDLENKLLPNQKITLFIEYSIKIPNDKFTDYGFNENGNITLKDWFLVPARFENHKFITNSNANIDDISNAISDYEFNITVPENLSIFSDLNLIEKTKTVYKFSGKNRNSFSLIFNKNLGFESFKTSNIEVVTDLKNDKIDTIQKAIIIDKIVNYINTNIGKYPFEKITISQVDYGRNPFYGLNQLPNFLNPFPNDFLYELKFLKTYLNVYLQNTLHLNQRKDNWIYDGIQIYFMMKYMDEYYPNAKMMGNIAKYKILKSFNLVNLDFNEQYSYFYMLMARKNLDQPIGDSKESFIKFNEKIAGKYRAGLSLRYLDNYLSDDKVSKSIQEFVKLNANIQTDVNDFEKILKSNSNKNIDWFFDKIINSRDLVDFKITDYSKTENDVTFTVKNRTQTNVPISVYGIKNKQIVFKYWLENIKTDSTFTFPNEGAEKLVLNYNNEVPEFNNRNNWKKIQGFFPNNRPLKFVLMKDLEEPNYNQILYVPAFNYNLYDGITVGMRFHNGAILNKPFNYDIQPLYASETKSLVGSFSFTVNHQPRIGKLYNIRYGFYGSTSHFAPNASYYKLNPVLAFSFRDKDYRSNKFSGLTFRHILVGREKTDFVAATATTADNENYSVFDSRYGSSINELTKRISYGTNLQIADKFGKVSTTFEYRKLFDNNQQLNLRFYAGAFLYRNTATDFFSFALDRPTDYLFDYDYIGRSEQTGFFSQQLIIAEGGFKTKVANSFANQWITSLNASTNIWNWVEVYGDVALFKNKFSKPKVLFDSGLRLNLVPDYFELYLPVYSSNGWDISKNYNQKIRFVVTISTNTLISLFTRKWF
jgi:hypothetical protein